MLLMMLFSYNSFSFLGSKASASSTTNTINFYGDDNYLIGSYEVPNGQSINDVVTTTTIDNSFNSSVINSALSRADVNVTTTNSTAITSSDLSKVGVDKV